MNSSNTGVNEEKKEARPSSFWKRGQDLIPGKPVRQADKKDLEMMKLELDISKKNNSQDKEEARPGFSMATPSTSPQLSRRQQLKFKEFLSETDYAWIDEEEEISKVFPLRQSEQNEAKRLFEEDKKKMLIEKNNGLRHEVIIAESKETEHETCKKGTINEIMPVDRLTITSHRMRKFEQALKMANVDLEELRQLSWSGIPDGVRPITWQLLLGYLPCNQERRASTLSRKRKEYNDCVVQYFGKGIESLDRKTYQQIHIDVPRTNFGATIFQDERIRDSLERILYIWAIRHPASGYVQGINDLVAPFFSVFLSSHADLDTLSSGNINDELLKSVEADTFWCLSKLLDGIQDNYIFGQPGIQRQVMKLKELVGRIDAPLSQHLQNIGIEFLQFAFRWMNCLLVREMTLANTIRMWDTYLSDGVNSFSDFHLYVCAAFLVKWSSVLKLQDFQDTMLFLQNVPSKNWDMKDVELLLSEAYMWKTLFHDSPSHLASGS